LDDLFMGAHGTLSPRGKASLSVLNGGLNWALSSRYHDCGFS
jgi:hypothetical protein